jgi:urea transporter
MGQIYFQASPVFGAVLLLCLYLNAPVLALGCALGVSISSLAAQALRLPEESRHNGLYSFNGALTGIGLCACYRFEVALLAWIVAAGLLTAALTQVMQRLRIPPLTLPFVLMMWLAMAIAAAVSVWPDSGIDAHGAGAGINSTLVMLALGSHQCRWRLRPAGAALSIALAVTFGSMSLPYFTLPFILSTWAILQAGRT